MKTSQVLIKIAAMAFIGAQFACSAKVTSGQNMSTQDKLLSTVMGVWTSNCYHLSSGGYAVTGMVIGSSTYQESLALYSDAACTQQAGQTTSATGSLVVQGTDSVLNGAIDIQMSYQDQNNQTQTGYSLVLLDGGHLYFPPQFAVGSSPQNRPTTVDRSVIFSLTSVPASGAVPAALIGVWQGACSSKSQRVITITSSNFDDTTTYFNDVGCTSPSGMSSTQNSGPLGYDGFDVVVSSGYDIHVAANNGPSTITLYNVVRVANNQLTMGPYWSGTISGRPTVVSASIIFTKK
jgi:hypothetical protein